MTLNTNTTKDTKLEDRFRLLYKITSQTALSTDEQLENALELACDLLDLGVGIISRIQDNTYVIKHFYPEESGLEKGQAFPLGDTYCSITLEADEAVSIPHMEKSPHKRHPCYNVFKLESYIGVPIEIDGTLYGTLNFSSTEPYETGFSATDKDFIRLLGEWVANTIKQQNITEQLRKSEERYELAVEGISAGLWDWKDMTKNDQWWSPYFYKLLGYKNGAFDANLDSFKQLLHPDDKERTFETLQHHFEVNKPFEVEYRLKTKSGEYKWFFGSGQARFDGEGNPTRMVGSIVDINERKKLELLLKETNALALVGGWEYNLQTSDLTWTDEVYHIHELPVGTEVKVEEGINYYAPKARPVIESAIEKAIETGKGWDLELPFITAKGNKKWVRAIGRVHYNDGKAYKLSGTFQDLTYRKEIEDELVKAKEKADAASQAKSRFIANMSHEIRTPMNAILGFTELLKSRIDGEISKNYVENIQSSGKNLLRLINDILDLSKIEAGKEEIQLQPVNVKRVLNEIAGFFSTKAVQKGVEIKIIVDEKIPQSLLLDEVRLRQILLNLVGNAVKFTVEGYVKIAAHADNNPDNESMVDLTIHVKDTGIGISQDKLDTIFQAFEQQDFSISQQYGGTGLGLAISKRLAGMMNGSITAESTEEEGSIFKLQIPGVTIASVMEDAVIETPDNREYTLQPASILIVDDIAVNRELVIEYLKEQPLELTEAGTGQEAIEIVKNETPDLVLMDIKMPGMSGIEAMQRIKEETDTTVVALTASGFKGFAKKAAQLGFDAYLRKPVSRQQLISELATFIGFDEEPTATVTTDSAQAKAGDWLGEIEEMDKESIQILLHQLEEELIPACNNIDGNAMIMSQYERFADLLKKRGKEHELLFLKKSAREIQAAVTLFDIQKIDWHVNRLKSNLPRLKKKLEDELENETRSKFNGE